MDIATLKQAVATALQSAPFRVTGAALGSAPVTRLLTDHLGADSLQLSGATRQAETDASVTVQGTLPAALYGQTGLAAAATFTVEGGTAHVSVLLTGLPAGWKPSRSFPALAGTALDAFTWASPSLVLDSRDTGLPAGFPADFGMTAYPAAFTAGQVRGLGLRATLSSTATAAGLASVLGGSQWPVSGPVSPNGERPSVLLSSDPRPPFSIAGFDVPFRLQVAAAYPVAPDGAVSAAPVATVQLSADVRRNVGSEQSPTILDIPLRARTVPGGDGVLLVQGDLAQASDLALEQVSRLIGGASTAGQVPALFPALDQIQLQGVSLVARPGAAQPLVSAGATVGLRPGTQWSVLDGLIVFRDLAVTFTWLPELGSVTTQVECSAVLGGGTLDAGIDLPSMDFRCELREGDTISITDLVRRVSGGSIGMPRVACTELAISGNVPEHRYRFRAAVTDDWVLDLGGGRTLALKQVGMDLSYGPELSGEVVGRVQVAGVEIYVAAGYDGSGGGWWFEGGTIPGQSIPIGTLVQDLARVFGVDSAIPASISSATIDRLHVGFDTATREFTFSCETRLTLDPQTTMSLVVDVDVQPSGSGYRKTFRGTALVGTREFDLVFDAAPAATRFLAAYENPGGGGVNLGELLRPVTTNPELIGPAGALSIDLRDALLAYEKPAGGAARFLFGADIGAGVDLANLPLVGRAFPSDATLSLAFQPLVASADFPADAVAALRALVPAGGLALPQAAVPKGLTLATRLQIGDRPVDLSLPLSISSGSGQISNDPSRTAPPPAGSTSAPDGTRWIALQKSFGPLHLQRVGARYSQGDLWFLLDGSLAAGGLTLELDGLAAGVSLADVQAHRFRPKFSLRGVSIDYRNGAVEVGGGLLHIPPATPGDPDEYAGGAVIRTAGLSLTAVGSYAELNGSRSLFLYAALDYPLGGPPFLFVTGLAAGFGFNRTVRRPALDQVASFSLVAEAVSGTASTPPAAGAEARSFLEAKLRALHDDLPVQAGAIFFAVGLKFTTFKLVESFALATVKVGQQVEVGVLGLSTALLPPRRAGESATPVAELQLALEATFLPQEGVLEVAAQLTRESYLLSRDCHLTGGFAFYCWFLGEHAGDFVLTVGGYHPSFNVPAHYPVVPRLGFNWQVTGNLSLKGGMYFALTAHTLMAGGELEAVWEDGSLSAWFRAEANFLVAWQPYHYEAGISVDVGVSYTYHFFGTHHISVDVGADLDVWGPDFSGRARVHLWIVSFTVSFGGGRPSAPALSWTEFRDAFLPVHDGAPAVVGVTATRGLSRQIRDTDGVELWVVDPKTLVLATDSVIPATAVTRGGTAVAGTYPAAGIAPMDVRAASVAATHDVRVVYGGARSDASASFAYRPLTKKAPAALWGDSHTPDLNAHPWVEGAVSGVEVTPAVPATPGATHSLRRADLAYETRTFRGAEVPLHGYRFTAGTPDGLAAVRQGIARDDVTAARAGLLRALGFDPAAVRGLDASVADDLLLAPRAGRVAPAP